MPNTTMTLNATDRSAHTAEPMTTTAPIVRTWLAFAALGTGMIHFALIAGSPVVVQIVLLALGLTEFGWGVLALARDALPAASVARVVALVPVIGWSLLIVASTLFGLAALGSMLPLIPMAIATALELAAAWMISRDIRLSRKADVEPTDTPAPGAARYLLGVLAGALVVGALVTPALAATTAGASATLHGDHGTSTTDLNVPAHQSH